MRLETPADMPQDDVMQSNLTTPAATGTIRYCHTDTPLGTILLTGNGGALSGLYFTGHEHSRTVGATWEEDEAPFSSVRHQLDEYFDGRRTGFDVKIALRGSPFELTVWEALQGIPYGTTVSYGEIAGRIGRPKAARAVGAANGRNPVSIIVPCHRVIGADASLTGYGWGVERKAWLIDHEKLSPISPSPRAG
jgi:methylated-DNA-[protein]-cysteine S-methyltransferase